MHIAHQKHTLTQIGNHGFDSFLVQSITTTAEQTFHHARLVTLGLQATDEPCAGIGKPFVIQIDRILCGEHYPQTKSSRLLHKSEQRQLRRRHGSGREVAEDFIHVHQRPQGRGTGLSAHPCHHFIEQQCNDEHAFGITEMRYGNDGYAGLAFSSEQQTLNVQCFTFHPGGKSRRSQQVVDRHSQTQAFFCRKESFQIKHAHLVERRLLYLLYQCSKIKIFTLAPGGIQHTRQQNVFTTLERIGINAEQRKQPGSCTGNAFFQC